MDDGRLVRRGSAPYTDAERAVIDALLQEARREALDRAAASGNESNSVGESR